MDSSTVFVPLLTLVIGFVLREISHLTHTGMESLFRARSISNDLIFPLVRVADELVGRTYHHIRSDYNDNVARTTPVSDAYDHNHIYDLYLWARFWAHTSRIRKNILSYRLSNTRDGKVLLQFLDCLEASKVTVIPRPVQRLVGDGYADEIGIDSGGSYFTFVRKLQEDAQFARAMEELNQLLVKAGSDKRIRRALLTYTITIHAMVDYLDKNRKVSSGRVAISNKLDKKSRRDLRHRILAVYTPLSDAEIQKYVACAQK